MLFDLIIKNGIVVDGTGNPWFKADVGIRSGLISDVDELPSESNEIIDASGLVVAPGFIDMHAHSDFSLLINPLAESKVRQGVTTEVIGNCGFSAAPLNDFLKRQIMEMSPILKEAKLKLNWSSMDEYLKKLERNGIALNVVPLVGNGNIRALVMGYESKQPSQNNLRKMKKILAKTIEEGAVGLSSGLIYPPSCYAHTGELIELSKIVAQYRGIYASHIRGEGETLIDSVREAIEIGKKSGISVEISHHKASGKRNWGKVKQTLKMIDEARSVGVDVTCDVYPYLAGMTGLDALLPTRAWEGGVGKLVERLRDPRIRRRLRREMKEGRSNLLSADDWDSVMVAYCGGHREYEGKTIAEIVEQKRIDPFDFLFDLLIEEKASVMIVIFTMCERDMRNVLKHPASMIGSDTESVAPYGVLGKGKPHPRTYGTFPRVLGEYARRKKVLTLENAIRKMTSFPAQKLRLNDRGLIRKGMWADVTVFSPEKIMDKATYLKPHQYPVGIKYVIVNGQLVIADGKHTRQLPGRVLRLQVPSSKKRV
ncbi:MAG TPA: D-aminoacylase [Candidatus Bathyarchaeia archaeon]|nr:D-aminoacylase [Candidatus Bathyarchaeia archaeon]